MIGIMPEKYIELNAFLKANSLAQTGGKAKSLIRSGAITVNGEVELRNRRKLHAGDIVVYQGDRFVVGESVLR
jgi:ribosome-associated protein